MELSDRLKSYAKSLKKRKIQLTPEERLKIAAEITDTVVKIQVERIMSELGCSYEEAKRILRERWMRARGAI